MPESQFLAWSRHACFAAFILLVACGRVDIDDLPAVPDVAMADALPGVQTQVNDAIQRVQGAPGDAEANAHLAMVLQTYKQFNAADIMYRRTRALDSRTFDWPYLHAIVLTALGSPAKARDAYRAALDIRDDYALANVRLAELLAEDGDEETAAQMYDSVLARPKPPPEAYFSHGKFLFRQGRVDEAIRRFEQTLDVSGDFGAVHYQLGLAYRDKKEFALAERHLQQAKLHHGESADSSDEILSRLLILNRNDQPFVQRAKRLAESGRLEEARRFIQMALERNPDSVAAHTNMIGMAAASRDFPKVDFHFNKAVSLEPGNAKIYFNLGMARIAEARYDDAQRAFEQSLDLDNSDPNTHVQLAILNHRNNRPVLTERYLRDALELEPRHQVGNWLLGELLTQNNKAEEALAYLRDAVELPHGLLPLMYVALAQAEAQSGDWSAAFTALDNGQAAAELANAVAHMGRVSQVRAELTAQREQEATGAND